MGKKIVKEIKEIIATILNIIYPPEDKCIICDAEEFVGICPLCKSKIKKIGLQEEILSYGFYGGILKELILSFKYKKNFTAGSVLAELLLELIKEEKIDIEVICYVPMSKKSIKKRGFNQCEILAKKLGDELNIPVSNCLVKKGIPKNRRLYLEMRDLKILRVLLK